jgi:hypothetical protein
MGNHTLLSITNSSQHGSTNKPGCKAGSVHLGAGWKCQRLEVPDAGSLRESGEETTSESEKEVDKEVMKSDTQGN